MNFTQARALFTQALVDVYRDITPVKGFGRSFFRDELNLTKLAKIEVERGFEFVAVDVLRNSDGNANQASRSTEKIIEPPFYSEWLPLNSLDAYDRVLANPSETFELAALTREAGQKTAKLRDKIERAYELQTWQVFKNGIVSLSKVAQVDYKRKALSMVDLGGSDYWTVSGSNPIEDLEKGCNFLRTVGKSNGGVVNAIMGSKALDAFLNNAKVKEIGELRRIDLITIKLEQRNALGASLYGAVTVGAYTVMIWTYPEFYDVVEGGNVVSKPYVDQNDVIMLPEAPRFVMSYNQVPQLLGDTYVPQTGAYLLREEIDVQKKAHKMYVESAGIAIPTAVDQIYTIKATNVANS